MVWLWAAAGILEVSLPLGLWDFRNDAPPPMGVGVSVHVRGESY